MKRQCYDTFTIGQHVALIKPLTSVAEIKKKIIICITVIAKAKINVFMGRT